MLTRLIRKQLLNFGLPVSNEYLLYIEYDLIYFRNNDSIIDLLSSRLYLVSQIESCDRVLFPYNYDKDSKRSTKEVGLK